MSSPFSEKMTSMEARSAWFRESEGKSGEEEEKLFEEYRRVSNIISKRESALVEEGWIVF